MLPLPCMARQGIVVKYALSSTLTELPLVVIAKGSEQQEGEIGKGVALCLLDGLDGAGDNDVGEVGEFVYFEIVQCTKEITPIVGISCVGHEK
jgi:hypothetical protein